MTIQEQAAICYKYGNLYPKAFPNALVIASELYKKDRIERKVEEA